MPSLDRIERYLLAEMAKLRTPLPVQQTAEAHPFVTISRQAGAGGHSLANVLLEVFERQPDRGLFGDWQIFDQRLCEIVAAEPLCAESLDMLLAEEYRKPANDFFHQTLRSAVDQDVVMARVFRVVSALASMGKAIIVGRGGSEVTRGMELGVHLRIIAPEDARIRRVAEVYGLTDREARNRARKLDTHRARLLKAHFQVDIDDPLGYDAVWNTGSASLLDIAEATAAMVRSRVAARQPT